MYVAIFGNGTHIGVAYAGAAVDVEINTEYGFYDSIVIHFMKLHLEKDQNLYVDNWYTSPALLKISSRIKLELVPLLNSIEQVFHFW